MFTFISRFSLITVYVNKRCICLFLVGKVMIVVVILFFAMLTQIPDFVHYNNTRVLFFIASAFVV